MPKWAWLGSRDPIYKFWDPLVIFERIELSASYLIIMQNSLAIPKCCTCLGHQTVVIIR